MSHWWTQDFWQAEVKTVKRALIVCGGALVFVVVIVGHFTMFCPMEWDPRKRFILFFSTIQEGTFVSFFFWQKGTKGGDCPPCPLWVRHCVSGCVKHCCFMTSSYHERVICGFFAHYKVKHSACTYPCINFCFVQIGYPGMTRLVEYCAKVKLLMVWKGFLS